jgi:hypothetical protein
MKVAVAQSSGSLAWDHDTSYVTGFAVTIDGVRTDYGLTPQPPSGVCGCSVPPPFSSGRHTVVVSAYSPSGETASTPMIVGPTANAGGPYAGQTGVALPVSGAGSTDTTATITGYVWRWGDGTADTSAGSPAASHIYATGGTFTITLTVTDSLPASHSATTSATISATGTATTYVSDAFTGTDGTALASHTPDTGGTWVDDQSGLQLSGNHVNSRQLFGDSRSHNTTAPSTADYDVSMNIIWSGATSDAVLGVVGRGAGNQFRSDGYIAYYDAGNNRWALVKLVGYNSTTLGTYAQTYTQGQTHTLKLSMAGTAITVYVDGVSQISVTDSSISAINHAGIYAHYGSSSTSMVGDNYLVAAAGGTVGPPPPAAPTSPNPATGSSGAGTTPTLTWSAAGATSYDVRLGAATPPPLVATGATSASYSPTALAAGTTYYWQIAARNNGGTTTGPVWTFSTAPAAAPQVPASPNPADLSSGISTTPTLTWSAPGATSYDVSFGSTTPPPLAASGAVSASYSPPALTAGTAYYWRIVARNGGGTATGAVWTFTTAPAAAPQAPTSPNPPGGSTLVGTRPTLTWSAPGATSYDIQFGASNPPAVVAVNQTGASYAPAALNAGTTYYWQIVARNGGGTTPGPVWSFTTGTATTYVSDSFTGTDGTALASHPADTGGAWVDDQSGLQLSGNHVNSRQLFGDARSHMTTAPSTADYDVSMDILWSGATSDAILGVVGRGDGVQFRGNGYMAYYDAGNNRWALVKLTGYNSTTLAIYPQTYTRGQTHALKLRMVGTAITVYVDGVSRISVTDSSVSAINNAGIYAHYASNSTSMVGDNFLVADAGSLTTGARATAQSAAQPNPMSPAAQRSPSTSGVSAADPGTVAIHASGLPASALHGSWSTASDPTSPDGVTLITPNGGPTAVPAPAALPTSYVDVTFDAPAGIPHTLWLRMQALGNARSSDSVWVQFSDALVDGVPAYPLGSASGLLVNLATDGSGLSLNGWGWQNGAYWLLQPTTVTFVSSGLHTLRIQAREDGVQLDQIVLSSTAYLTAAPGPATKDSTIVRH